MGSPWQIWEFWELELDKQDMLFEQFSQSWTLSGAPHEFEEVIRNLHAHDSCPKRVGAYRGTDMCKLKLQTEKAMPSGIGAASAASSSVGEEGRVRTQQGQRTRDL